MSHRATTIATYTLLAAAAGVSLALPSSLPISLATPMQATETIHLGGVIRDFRTGHSDFAVIDPTVMGHYVDNVAHTLGIDERPVYTGGSGRVVITEWQDAAANPIWPHAPAGDDGGLPGGHFDVDVFDEPDSTNELYHEHAFDDEFDITYVDVVNDANLLFDSVVGAAYPNDLRLELLNPHNGGLGTYTFEAGTGPITGAVAGGLTATFTPADLVQLRIDFATLNSLQHTSPGDVQGDAVDRFDSLSIRMFDVTTDTLVYELAIYHHGDAADVGGGAKDSCGNSIADVPGALGASGGGGITDAASFAEWYEDVLGTNLSFAHAISLERDAAGVYEYLAGDFFPADGRAFGDEGDAHNNYFTYEISASFTYGGCTGQFFEFQGNDDAWVFIDGQLVIDLGGVAHGERQRVELDRFGLVDGQDYDLGFFYAHRRDAAGSTFNMRTNLELRSHIPTMTAAFD